MYGSMNIEEDAAWPFSQKLIMTGLTFSLNVVVLSLLISIIGDSDGQVLEMKDTRLDFRSSDLQEILDGKEIFGLLFPNVI